MSDDSHEYDEDALDFIEDERVRIAALHATCPKQIWLQIDPEAEQFDGWDAQTWCSDKINETDVRYVLAASRDVEIAGLVAALEGARESLDAIRLAVEPYDDIKPRDWKSDRANLRDAHTSAKETIEAVDTALAKVRKP